MPRPTPASPPSLLAPLGLRMVRRAPAAPPRADPPPSAPAAAQDAPPSTAHRLLAIQAAMLSHERAAVAVTDFATELARQFGCSRVVIGEGEQGALRATAVSHGSGDPLEGDAFDSVVAAMEEAVLQACVVHFPAGANERVLIRLAHTRWQQRTGGCVLSMPLVLRGRVVGALACEWSQVRDDLTALGLQIEDVAAFAAPVLQLLRDGESPWHQRLRRALRSQWQALDDPARRRGRLALAASALGLIALGAVPIEHEVAARARIEGEQQRALVAPADGYLKSVAVRPGDEVRAGQVLVELADQDLLLERQRWTSELGQQESAYATAMLRADRPQMVMALGRLEQARAQLAKTEAQIQRATVTAPFDGVVLQGDLAQLVGSPMERGKPLLTVAPDRRYRVVADVDERDIGLVTDGQTGQLALAALPWQRLSFRIRRVVPMARASDRGNVFEVEAALDPGMPALRPGLEGVARIRVGQRACAWVWTHRMLAWLRLRTWAWWG